MSRDRIDRLYEAIRRADQAYEVWAAAHGLTLYELQIYYEMMKNEGEAIRQKDLCKTLDAPKTSINSMVKKRMQSGHFCMDVNPENKREKIISFTSEGKKFAKELIEPLFQYEEKAAGMISEQEMENAIRVQNQFADILLKKVEQ